MANFQRTRSKVWWGNSPSPPNIGSPLPGRSRRENLREEEWEPQLPRWPEQDQLSPLPGNETPPGDRHSTPNSHKSQDSGFSDSDSSPPQPVQPIQPQTPQNCTASNCTAARTPACGYLNGDTPVRSVIKTPRDLHNYIEAHCDVGHAVFDSVTQESTPGKPIRVTMTPCKNINNNHISVDKCPLKRSVLQSVERPGPKAFSKESSSLHGTSHFQRRGCNRSFHSTRGNNQQSDDEETHSLGYIEVMREEPQDHVSFFSRTMKDSFYLKRSFIKSKAKNHHKNVKGKLNLMINKKESIKTIYDITDNTERVPSLGLPSNSHASQDKVLEQGHDEQNILNCKSSPGSSRRLTPPMQFRDRSDASKQYNGCESSNENLYFNDEEISNMCTSTPKAMFGETQKSSNIKPTNLLDNFNKNADQTESFRENSWTCITPLEEACQGKEGPVQQWLCGLAGTTDGEVGTLLQSKPIGKAEQSTISHASNTITGNIRKVHTHALIITHMAQDTIKELDKSDGSQVKYKAREINSISANMNDFIMTHSITLKVRPPNETPERWNQISLTLEQNIHKAQEINEDIKLELSETIPEVSVLRKHVVVLYKIFSETVRVLLTQQVMTLVGLLEDPPSDTMLKSILTSLGQLGRCSLENEEGSVCQIPLVPCGVPRALLELIITTTKSSIKALSFRALATICTSGEAVEQFDNGGGLEILCEVLNERNVPEPQTREVVTVLAQVTAPWLRGHYALPSLDTHLNTIIMRLSDILSKTQCCQLLLLSTAALVNVIRSIRREGKGSWDVVSVLKKYCTIAVLLEAVKRKGPQASVFLQEQVAALLDLVTCCGEGRALVADCSASCVALICFLRPTSPVTPHVTAQSSLQQAETRLLRHTTEALARLCTIPEVCEKVIQLEGPSRIVRVILSKPPKGPLVSMLRALRSLHHYSPHCIPFHIQPHIRHMVHLPLMQAVSYYQHCTLEESYV